MKTAYELDDADIRAIALDCGFKLKPQPDGLEDLNPYVYKFARELLSTIPRPEDVAALRERLTPPASADEPVAWQIEYTHPLGVKLRTLSPDNILAAFVDNTPDAVAVPLYTRPDNSGLRKAAEKAAEVLEWYHEERVAAELRAELERLKR